MAASPSLPNPPFFDVVTARRSIRAYTDDPVSDEQVRKLLEAAFFSPSGNAVYPWHFIVIRDAATRAALGRLTEWSDFAAQAPVVIAVAAEAKETSLWIEDASIAAAHLLLGATALGLGGCWIQVRDETWEEKPCEPEARRILGVPESIRILCLIAFGAPAEHPPAHGSADYREQRVHFDRWGTHKPR